MKYSLAISREYEESGAVKQHNPKQKGTMPKSKTRAASMRGKRNAAKPEGTQRVSLSVAVKPDTLAYVESLAKENKASKGKTVDLLAEYHKRNSF